MQHPLPVFLPQLQAFFLVADDIMDGSITRRGAPCWYKVPKVGMIACNDYILLECFIYRLLKFHMASHPLYAQVLDLFHEVSDAVSTLRVACKTRSFTAHSSCS